MNRLSIRRMTAAVRFASTASVTKTFLPSVSWLIEKNNLDADVISKIPASGPKNNLLKGDVLKFLQEGGTLQSIDEILGNENYYQLDLKTLDNEWLTALKKSKSGGVDLGALYKKLDSTECTVTKISSNNEVSRTLDLASKSNSSKAFDRIKSGSFRFVDCLALGSLEEAPTFHTLSGEAAVLSVHQPGSFAEENSLDFLVGTSSATHNLKPKVKNESDDLIDYLTSTSNTPKSVRLELVVDGRTVDEKTATQFLRQIKDLVDQRE